MWPLLSSWKPIKKKLFCSWYRFRNTAWPVTMANRHPHASINPSNRHVTLRKKLTRRDGFGLHWNIRAKLTLRRKGWFVFQANEKLSMLSYPVTLLGIYSQLVMSWNSPTENNFYPGRSSWENHCSLKVDNVSQTYCSKKYIKKVLQTKSAQVKVPGRTEQQLESRYSFIGKRKRFANIKTF